MDRPAARRLSIKSAYDDGPYPVPTRSGALATLIRSRSSQSISSLPHHHSRAVFAADEEAGGPHDDAEIERLLKDERRMSQILGGPHVQARSKSLLGKSNPRYRWEQYWTHEAQLKTMPKPM
jgi:hypothetical protein